MIDMRVPSVHDFLSPKIIKFRLCFRGRLTLEGKVRLTIRQCFKLQEEGDSGGDKLVYGAAVVLAKMARGLSVGYSGVIRRGISPWV